MKDNNHKCLECSSPVLCSKECKKKWAGDADHYVTCVACAQRIVGTLKDIANESHTKYTCRICYNSYVAERFYRYHFLDKWNDSDTDYIRVNKTSCDGDFRNPLTNCSECIFHKEYLKLYPDWKLYECHYDWESDPDMKEYLYQIEEDSCDEHMEDKCRIHGKCPYVGLPFDIASWESHMHHAISWIKYEVDISKITSSDTLDEFRERIRSLVDMDSCLCDEARWCTCPGSDEV